VLPGAAAAALAPPVVWLGLAWLGSGTPLLQLVQITGASGCTCPAALAAPVLPAIRDAVLLRNMTEAIAPPALLLAAAAPVLLPPSRRRDALVIAGVAVAWTGIVLVMTAVGYPGSRRYFMAPVGLIAVLAGAGTARALTRIGSRRGRTAAGAALIAVLALVTAGTVRENARTVGVARAQDEQLAELRQAIALVGGRAAVLARGPPAINPDLQSALAWRLGVPLARVQASWHSSPASPHWHPPALVFRAPNRLAGTRPALSGAQNARWVGRAGRWQVLEVRGGS
jgi:hypothetical protein